MILAVCYLKKLCIIKSKFVENGLLVVTHIFFFPPNRSLVSYCCGTGSERFLECSPRRWCCSIFPALPPFLQPEEVIDLKLFFTLNKWLYFKCSVPDKMSPKSFVLMCIAAALWCLLTLSYNGSCSFNL